MGFGTIASRSTVTVSAAIHCASERLREKVFAIAANMLECAAGDLELRNGGVGVVGVPGAEADARPAWRRRRVRAGITAGRRAWMPAWRRPITTSRRQSPGPTPSHAAIVEVDIERARCRSSNTPSPMTAASVVNPMLVEGQIVGGTVQGLGGALLEEFGYDAEGQLLTGSFMDYMLPTACEIPQIAADPSAFAFAAQSARREGRRRRRRDCAAGGDRQCRVRCAAGVQGRVQSHADQATAYRAGGSIVHR